MSSSHRNRKDVFSLKPLLAGVALLLLGAGVFAYYLIPRAAAVSVEQVPEAPLPETKVETGDQPDTSGTPEKDSETPREPGVPGDQDPVPAATREIRRTITKNKVPKPVETGPPVIELTSPVSLKTLRSTDPLTVEARVSSHGKKTRRVEFYYSRIGSSGAGIYNTVSGVQIANSPLVRIGTAIGNPYRLNNVRLERGVFSIYAIVTTRDGLRQISAPVTIIIKDEYTAAGGKWLPSPSPEPLSCLAADVFLRPLTDNSLFDRTDYLLQGNVVRFRVETAIIDPSLKYRWRLSNGTITGGQNSAAITVDTTGLGGQTLMATVEIENDKGCKTSVSGRARIVQEQDWILNSSSFAAPAPSSTDFFPRENGYTNCPLLIEKLGLVTTLFDAIPVDHTGVSEEFKERWRGDAIICPRNRDQFLDENNRLLYKLGHRTDGVLGDTLKSWNFTNGGSIEVEGDDVIWDLTAVKDIPGDYSAVFEIRDPCGGGSLVAKTVHIANYCGPCMEGFSVSNLGDLEQHPASVGIHLTAPPDFPSQKEPHFDWATVEGEILDGQGTPAITVSDWTSIEASRVALDVKAEISGLSHRSGVLTLTADLPAFEENYFRLLNGFQEIPVQEMSSGEKERAKTEAADSKKAFKDQLKYDWTLSGPSGGVIASGKSTGTLEIDLRSLDIPEKVGLSVKITGWNILFFIASSMLEDGPDGKFEKDLKCDWAVSKGRVIWAQRSGFLAVAELDLPTGTPVTAEVQCEGLKKDCPYSLLIQSEVGRVYGGGGASPMATPGARPETRARLAEKGDMSAPPGTSGSQTTTVVVTGSSPNAASGPPPPQAAPQTSPTPLSGKTAGKEFIKIAWPAPAETVYVNQAFSVIVTYKRSAEALQITDGAGEVVAELKSGDLKRLIKDRFGPGAETMAQIRLQSAGFYQSDTVTCSPNCQGDYLSLAADEQKWTFNVTAHNPGDHKFNLEMWVKPKMDDPANPPEKVWGKEDMKVTVRAEAPTRFQIYGASGILGVFGLIFFARGVNLKVLIAGGDIVGGDKVGGHKVGGDMVGGDKITNGESGPDG